MDFKIEINLQRLGTIAFAASIWNRPCIIDQVQQKMEEATKKEGWHISEIYPLIKEIKEELKTINLPRDIFNDIVHAVISLGIRVLDWYFYLKCKLLVPFKYTRTLCWTYLGMIDQAKIVETEWVVTFDKALKENVEEDSVLFNLRFALYYMICTGVLSSYINLHWDEILKFCFKYFEALSVYRPQRKMLVFVIFSVIFIAKPNPQHLSSDEYRTCLQVRIDQLQEHSEILFMLLLSPSDGHHVAFQHYLKLLHSESSNFEIQGGPMLIHFLCHTDYSVDNKIFHPHKYADTSVFLAMILAKDHKWVSLNQVIKYCPEYFLQIFIYSLTWEEFYIPAFQLIKASALQSNNKKLFHKVIKMITKAWALKFDLGFTDCKRAVNRKMFFAVWEEIEKLRTSDCLLMLPELPSEGSCFLNDLYKIFDVEILNLVINFECDKKCRDQVLKAGQEKYKELILEGRSKLLDQFENVVLKSESEKEWFKNYLNSVTSE